MEMPCTCLLLGVLGVNEVGVEGGGIIYRVALMCPFVKATK